MSDDAPGSVSKRNAEGPSAEATPDLSGSRVEEALVVFQRPSADGTPLRQGEVVADIVQHRRSFSSLKSGQYEIEEILHPFAVIASQDCDLEQDHKARFSESADAKRKDKLIPNVLLLHAVTIDELQLVTPSGSDIWKRIKQNKDERYHLLEAAGSPEDAQGKGVPALGLDFKQFFTLPTDELYFQLQNKAKRRYFLESPYLEDLTKRFATFLCRVALPRPHNIK